MKILILKFKTIGDVLLITPLIRNLKTYYPKSFIDVAVNSGTEDMLTLNKNISNIFVYPRERIRHKPLIKRIKSELGFLYNIKKNKYDMVIDLDYGDRGAIISIISGAHTKVGSRSVGGFFIKNTYTHLLPERKGKHIVEVGLDALRSLKIPITDKKIELFWHTNDQSFIDNLIGFNDFIHVHPFSRAPWKEINVKSLAEIIDYRILDLGFQVIVTSSTNERELIETKKLVNLCKSKPIDLSGKLTLRQTAALNKKAKLFIGVDTAIMHISSANNIPVFAFFGPSAVDNWGPWDNNLQLSTYARLGGVQSNGIHVVYSENLDCIGCNQHGCNDELVSKCLNVLNNDSVKKNINLMLGLKNTVKL